MSTRTAVCTKCGTAFESSTENANAPGDHLCFSCRAMTNTPAPSESEADHLQRFDQYGDEGEMGIDSTGEWVTYDDASNAIVKLEGQLKSAQEQLAEAKHQQKLAWERHAEKDAAYGDMIAQRDALRAECARLVRKDADGAKEVARLREVEAEAAALRITVAQLRGAILELASYVNHPPTTAWEKISGVLASTPSPDVVPVGTGELAELRFALCRATGSLGLILKGANKDSIWHKENYDFAISVINAATTRDVLDAAASSDQEQPQGK